MHDLGIVGPLSSALRRALSEFSIAVLPSPPICRQLELRLLQKEFQRRPTLAEADCRTDYRPASSCRNTARTPSGEDANGRSPDRDCVLQTTCMQNLLQLALVARLSHKPPGRLRRSGQVFYLPFQVCFAIRNTA